MPPLKLLGTVAPVWALPAQLGHQAPPQLTDAGSAADPAHLRRQNRQADMEGLERASKGRCVTLHAALEYGACRHGGITVNIATCMLDLSSDNWK